jgi:uncharacterized protein YdeI (YjbR/CyaY-like superfamily)
LRKIVHAACPGVTETMKWSFPHFEYKGILCSMAAFTRHCSLNFWKGALLGIDGNKASEAMGQFGRIASREDLPSDRTLINLVKQAAALNEQGVKAPREKTTAKPAARPPADLLSALKKNRKALATFEAFSPSHRREYIEWITEAKSDATRQRRLQTTIEWLSEGKGRNWKYERS